MVGLQGGEVLIGQHLYQFSLLPVAQGHPLRWEMISVLGQSLMRALAQAAAGGGLGETKVESILGDLASVLERLDPKFVLRLQKTFIDVTSYKDVGGGQWVDLSKTWEVHFAGRYHELDMLTWAHLKANYLSFLDGSAVWKAVVSAGARALSAAQSQRTSSSTGTSGESSAANVSASA